MNFLENGITKIKVKPVVLRMINFQAVFFAHYVNFQLV